MDLKVEEGRRVRSRVVWGIVVALLLLSFVYAFLSSRQASTPTRQIHRLESELKCPSCVDIPVLDSNSASSVAIRDFITKQVARGDSDTAIIDALVTDYGNAVLLVPPKSGLDIFLWLTPVVVLGFFGYELLSGTRRGRPRTISNELHVTADRPAVSKREVVSAAVQPLTLRSRRGALLVGAVLAILAGFAVLGDALFGTHAPSTLTAASNAAIVAMNTQLLEGELLASQGDDVSALKIFSSVLKKDPVQPQALAYEGWLLFQAGRRNSSTPLTDQGTRLVKDATVLDPPYSVGHLFLGLIYEEGSGQSALAVAQFTTMFKEKLSASLVAQTKPEILAAYQQAGIAPPKGL